MDSVHSHLLSKAGITPRLSTNPWTFIRLGSDTTSHPHLKALQNLRNQWQRTALKIPHFWMPPNDESHATITSLASLPKIQLSLFLAPAIHNVTILSDSEIIDQCTESEISPDFCLTIPRAKGALSIVIDYSIPPFIVYRNAEELAEHCTQMAANFVAYAGSKSSASSCLSGLFVGIPGCWVIRFPNKERLFPILELPSPRPPSPATQIDFALLLHLHGSSFPAQICRDAFMSISFAHPALIIAVKGPTSWEGDVQGTRTLDQVIEDLALHVQSSLETMIATWHFRHKDEGSIPSLPDYAVIFGIIYDATHLHLIAHFAHETEQLTSAPSPRFKYTSCVIDSFEFLSVPSKEDPDWSIKRLQVLIALLTVQRHAFRLSSLWDGVCLPKEILADADAKDDMNDMGPSIEILMSEGKDDETDEDEHDEDEHDEDEHDKVNGEDDENHDDDNSDDENIDDENGDGENDNNEINNVDGSDEDEDNDKCESEDDSNRDEGARGGVEARTDEYVESKSRQEAHDEYSDTDSSPETTDSRAEMEKVIFTWQTAVCAVDANI